MYTPESDLSSELKSWVFKNLLDISNWISHQAFPTQHPPTPPGGIFLLSLPLSLPISVRLAFPRLLQQKPEHHAITLPSPDPTSARSEACQLPSTVCLTGAHLSPPLLLPLQVQLAATRPWLLRSFRQQLQWILLLQTLQWLPVHTLLMAKLALHHLTLAFLSSFTSGLSPP